MRVLINATAYGDPPGGAGLRARHLFGALRELGNYDLLFLLAEDTPEAIVPPGVEVRRLPVRATARFRRFRTLRTPTDGDVLITDHYPASSEVPTLITLHDDGGPWWRRALIRRHLRRAAGVLAVSTAVRKAWGIDATVVPNAVSVPDAQALRDRYGDIAVRPLLLMVDPGPAHKGIRIARQLANCVALPLREVGRGVKWLPQDELWCEIAAAAVVLCPATREAFGMVALEAMALGRPVVVRDLPAFRETLGEHAFYGESQAELEAAVRAAMAATPQELEAAQDHARKQTWQRSAKVLAKRLRAFEPPS